MYYIKILFTKVPFSLTISICTFDCFAICAECNVALWHCTLAPIATLCRWVLAHRAVDHLLSKTQITLYQFQVLNAWLDKERTVVGQTRSSDWGSLKDRRYRWVRKSVIFEDILIRTWDIQIQIMDPSKSAHSCRIQSSLLAVYGSDRAMNWLKGKYLK